MKDNQSKTPKLSLNRETVRELTREELRQAAGGVIALPTQMCTGYYPSINYPCVSYKVCA
ncbi:MAG: class I lanthipeptide [Candidatus Dormibacteria bacterium]